MGKLDQALQFLRANNLFTCGAKEFLGSNIPHVLMVMNPAEMLEQGITQFGQLFVQIPMGLTVNRLLDATLGRLVPPDRPQELWRIGKSLATYCAVGGGLLLMPKVRNAVSISRTGKTDFVGMVGLHQQQDDPDKARRTIQDNVRSIKRIGLTAIGLTLGLATAGALASRKGLTLPRALLNGLNQITLPQGNYAQLKDVGAMLSWAMPAYVGLWLGSRDRVEKQEVLIRAAGWGFAFTLIPRALERGLNRALEGRQFGLLGGGKNVAYAAQLALSVGLYTLIPTFVALVTRRNRAKQAGLLPNSPQNPSLEPVQAPFPNGINVTVPPPATSYSQTAPIRLDSPVYPMVPLPVAIRGTPVQPPLMPRLTSPYGFLAIPPPGLRTAATAV